MDITIAGIPPYDGTYDFPLAEAPLTTSEWAWVKKFSGYLPLTLDEGINGGDPELICAFALVAIYRAGKLTYGDAARVFRVLADAPFGESIVFDVGDEVEEEADPPRAPELVELPRSDGASSESSGTPSSDVSAPSELYLEPTGTPA